MKMFGKKDDSSGDFSKRSTRSIYKSRGDSRPGSITHTKAQSEIEYRNQKNADIVRVVVSIFTIIGVVVAVATYLKG